MSSFLDRLDIAASDEAVGTLSPTAKNLLPDDSWLAVEDELKRLQSDIAGHLSRVEQRLKLELNKNNKPQIFAPLRRQIRTDLAKWLYLSGIKRK